MNKLVILFAVVAAVSAVSVRTGGDEKDAHVVRHDADVHAEGYHYSYETSNGVSAEEQGALHGEAIAAQGSFKYTAPDGTPVQVTYVADENGFQPQGAHLPVGPAVPEHILRALEYVRTHAPHEEKTRGKLPLTRRPNY